MPEVLATTLTREHAADLLRVEADELRRLRATYEAARKEVLARLSQVPADRFTAQQLRSVQVQIEAGLRKLIAELQDDGERLVDEVLAHGIEQTLAEIAFFEPEFRGGATQRIRTLAARRALAPRALLLHQYQVSINTYGETLIGDVQRRLGVHLVKNSSWREMSLDVAGRLDQNAIQGARWRAERIVRTEMVEVLNAGHLAGLEESAELLPGLAKQWDSFLDTRTSKVCIQFNGRVRALDQPFGIHRGRPIMRPPAIPNCRSRVVPWMKEWAEQGDTTIDPKAAPKPPPQPVTKPVAPGPKPKTKADLQADLDADKAKLSGLIASGQTGKETGALTTRIMAAGKALARMEGLSESKAVAKGAAHIGEAVAQAKAKQKAVIEAAQKALDEIEDEWAKVYVASGGQTSAIDARLEDKLYQAAENLAKTQGLDTTDFTNARFAATKAKADQALAQARELAAGQVAAEKGALLAQYQIPGKVQTGNFAKALDHQVKLAGKSGADANLDVKKALEAAKAEGAAIRQAKIDAANGNLAKAEGAFQEAFAAQADNLPELQATLEAAARESALWEGKTGDALDQVAAKAVAEAQDYGKQIAVTKMQAVAQELEDHLTDTATPPWAVDEAKAKFLKQYEALAKIQGSESPKTEALGALDQAVEKAKALAVEAKATEIAQSPYLVKMVEEALPAEAHPAKIADVLAAHRATAGEWGDEIANKALHKALQDQGHLSPETAIEFWHEALDKWQAELVNGAIAAAKIDAEDVLNSIQANLWKLKVAKGGTGPEADEFAEGIIKTARAFAEQEKQKLARLAAAQEAAQKALQEGQEKLATEVKAAAEFSLMKGQKTVAKGKKAALTKKANQGDIPVDAESAKAAAQGLLDEWTGPLEQAKDVDHLWGVLVKAADDELSELGDLDVWKSLAYAPDDVLRVAATDHAFVHLSNELAWEKAIALRFKAKDVLANLVPEQKLISPQVAKAFIAHQKAKGMPAPPAPVAGPGSTTAAKALDTTKAQLKALNAVGQVDGLPEHAVEFYYANAKAILDTADEAVDHILQKFAADWDQFSPGAYFAKKHAKEIIEAAEAKFPHLAGKAVSKGADALSPQAQKLKDLAAAWRLIHDTDVDALKPEDDVLDLIRAVAIVVNEHGGNAGAVHEYLAKFSPNVNPSYAHIHAKAAQLEAKLVTPIGGGHGGLGSLSKSKAKALGVEWDWDLDLPGEWESEKIAALLDEIVAKGQAPKGPRLPQAMLDQVPDGDAMAFKLTVEEYGKAGLAGNENLALKWAKEIQTYPDVVAAKVMGLDLSDVAPWKAAIAEEAGIPQHVQKALAKQAAQKQDEILGIQTWTPVTPPSAGPPQVLLTDHQKKVYDLAKALDLILEHHDDGEWDADLAEKMALAVDALHEAPTIDFMEAKWAYHVAAGVDLDDMPETQAIRLMVEDVAEDLGHQPDKSNLPHYWKDYFDDEVIADADDALLPAIKEAWAKDQPGWATPIDAPQALPTLSPAQVAGYDYEISLQTLASITEQDEKAWTLARAMKIVHGLNEKTTGVGAIDSTKTALAIVAKESLLNLSHARKLLVAAGGLPDEPIAAKLRTKAKLLGQKIYGGTKDEPAFPHLSGYKGPDEIVLENWDLDARLAKFALMTEESGSPWYLEKPPTKASVVKAQEHLAGQEALQGAKGASSFEDLVHSLDLDPSHPDVANFDTAWKKYGETSGAIQQSWAAEIIKTPDVIIAKKLGVHLEMVDQWKLQVAKAVDWDADDITALLDEAGAIQAKFLQDHDAAGLVAPPKVDLAQKKLDDYLPLLEGHPEVDKVKAYVASYNEGKHSYALDILEEPDVVVAKAVGIKVQDVKGWKSTIANNAGLPSGHEKGLLEDAAKAQAALLKELDASTPVPSASGAQPIPMTTAQIVEALPAENPAVVAASEAWKKFSHPTANKGTKKSLIESLVKTPDAIIAKAIHFEDLSKIPTWKKALAETLIDNEDLVAAWLKQADEIQAGLAQVLQKSAAVPPPPAVPKAVKVSWPAQQSGAPQRIDLPDGKVAEKVGGAQGSNAGGWYQTGDGQKLYVKFPSSVGQVGAETTTAELARLMGMKTKDYLAFASKDGKHVAIASPKVTFKTLDGPKIAGWKAKDEVAEHFVHAAWTRNWDVVGMGYDNLVDVNGKLVVVDYGGSLLWRAQGALKTDGMPKIVAELKSLREAGANSYTAKAFSKLTDKDIAHAIQAKLADLDEEDIIAAVARGNFSDADEAVIRKGLLERKEYLEEWAEGVLGGGQKKLAPNAVQHALLGDLPNDPEVGIKWKPGADKQSKERYTKALGGDIESLKKLGRRLWAGTPMMEQDQDLALRFLLTAWQKHKDAVRGELEPYASTMVDVLGALEKKGEGLGDIGILKKEIERQAKARAKKEAREAAEQAAKAAKAKAEWEAKHADALKAKAAYEKELAAWQEKEKAYQAEVAGGVGKTHTANGQLTKAYEKKVDAWIAKLDQLDSKEWPDDVAEKYAGAKLAFEDEVREQQRFLDIAKTYRERAQAQPAGSYHRTYWEKKAKSLENKSARLTRKAKAAFAEEVKKAAVAAKLIKVKAKHPGPKPVPPQGIFTAATPKDRHWTTQVMGAAWEQEARAAAQRAGVDYDAAVRMIKDYTNGGYGRYRQAQMGVRYDGTTFSDPATKKRMDDLTAMLREMPGYKSPEQTGPRSYLVRKEGMSRLVKGHGGEREFAAVLDQAIQTGEPLPAWGALTSASTANKWHGSVHYRIYGETTAVPVKAKSVNSPEDEALILPETRLVVRKWFKEGSTWIIECEEYF